MVAGLSNASTAAGSGASIQNVEREFSPAAPFIPMKSVHCLGRTVLPPRSAPHPGCAPHGYGVAAGTR